VLNAYVPVFNETRGGGALNADVPDKLGFNFFNVLVFNDTRGGC
jgi:hypothetical protein